MPAAEAAARLSDAVRALSVDAERARPGQIHVADYRAGRISGRPHTFCSDSTMRGIRARPSRIRCCSTRSAGRSTSFSRRSRCPCIASVPGNTALPPSEVRRAPARRTHRRAIRAGTCAASISRASHSPPRSFWTSIVRAPAVPESDYSTLLEAIPEAAGISTGVAAALARPSGALAARGGRPRRSGRSRGASGARRVPSMLGRRPPGGGGARLRGVHDLGPAGCAPGTPELDPRSSGEPQSASRLETLAQCPYRYCSSMSFVSNHPRSSSATRPSGSTP